MQQETLAIDFDGVVHDYKNPIPGRRMGGPIAGAMASLTSLSAKYKIVVFCVWASSPSGVKTIADWMEYYHIPYDEITNIKPQAKAYIDDKGIRFNNWNETMTIISLYIR